MGSICLKARPAYEARSVVELAGRVAAALTAGDITATNLETLIRESCAGQYS